jgi:hypothetical protein
MWYEGNPCNMHLLKLAEEVKRGVVSEALLRRALGGEGMTCARACVCVYLPVCVCVCVCVCARVRVCRGVGVGRGTGHVCGLVHQV